MELQAAKPWIFAHWRIMVEVEGVMDCGRRPAANQVRPHRILVIKQMHLHDSKRPKMEQALSSFTTATCWKLAIYTQINTHSVTFSGSVARTRKKK